MTSLFQIYFDHNVIKGQLKLNMQAKLYLDFRNYVTNTIYFKKEMIKESNIFHLY